MDSIRAEAQKAAFREAAFQILMAVARMLSDGKLANSAELRALSQRALVQDAVARARASGRQPRATHIATETGISRNDVARLMLGKPALSRAVLRGRAIAEYVLSHWYSRVRDKMGRPAPLDMPGLVALLKRLNLSAKRAAPIAQELERAGVLIRLKDGRLKPVRQSYTAVQRDRTALVNAAAQARRYLEALFARGESAENEIRFVRIIESELLLPSGAARIGNEFVEDGQALLDRTTDSFSRRRYAATPGSTGKRIFAAVHIITESGEASQTTANVTRTKRKRRNRVSGKGRRSPRGVEAT